MVEDCYILYSCDGSYDPIVTNYSGFSAYSSTFIGVELVDTSITADTCFYVLSLGVVDCPVTDNVIPVTGLTCDCPCYCYFIRSANNTTDVTYIDCNNDLIIETIQSGLTYNICSKVYPQFDNNVQIPLKLTDFCVDNQCPPTLPTVKPANECDVITLFPMSVECLIQQPSNDKTFDGSTALIITGGTPPYTIFWEVGSFAPALTNLGVGSYTATVTDYYGDFSATTTCVLTAETLSLSAMCFEVRGVTTQPVSITTQPQGLLNGKPYYFLQYGVQNLGYVYWDGGTNLWTFCVDLDCQVTPINTLDNGGYFYPTGATNSWVYNPDNPIIIVQSTEGPCTIPVIPKEEYDLCVNLEVRSNKQGFVSQLLKIQMDPSNEINGEPSWTSSTGQYVIYWNTGATPDQWVMTGYPSTTLINYDPSYPPLTNWQTLGSPIVYNMVVLTGICSSAYTINTYITANDALCNQQGSITVSADGGVGPYQYSINSGQSYQVSPIFNNLQPGTYYVLVKDSNNVTSSVSQTVINGTQPASYTVTLNANYPNNTFTITAPTLPAGVTIDIDLVMSSWFSYYPLTLLTTPTYNNITTINGSYQMTLVTTNTNLIPLTGPCTIPGPVSIFQTQKIYTNTITLSSNQVVTGSTTNSIINDPIGKCRDAAGYYQLTITNSRIYNCQCCSVILNNPKAVQPIILP
jgi:hypothetical protein